MTEADLDDIRSAVESLCARYPESYWRGLDKERAYPSDFVAEMTAAGFLSCLIPQEWGGSGLGLREACAILETICFTGGNAGACHAQMYVMGSILRHGSQAQMAEWLPGIASGELRMQSFGVTEPTTGSDTTNLKTTAVRKGNRYVVNGQKIWISRVEHSDLMLVLARTADRDSAGDRTDGLTALIVDIRGGESRGLTIRPIESMINHHSCELFFDDFEVPVENRLGKENKGFRVLLDSMNAERILIAAECVGDARYFLKKASDYARGRVVFGKPIGANQGVQFPIAKSYADTRAAALMVYHAAERFDLGAACGAEANMAKLLAAEASWNAGDTAMQTHGGFAFAREFDIERKFREARLFRIAPVSTNLILSFLAERELGLPRSY